MGLFSRFWQRKDGGNVTNSLELLLHVFGGSTSKSGASVSVNTALDVTTILRCAIVLSDAASTVPVKLYRAMPDGSRLEARDHPLWDVITSEPNEWQDSLQFREMMTLQMVLTGNAYAYKNIVRGRIVELIPLDRGTVTVTRNNDRSLKYRVTAPNGRVEDFPQELIWHLRGPSIDGWVGIDTVRRLREAIGLALVTEEAHSRLHKNGVQTGGLYSVDGKLSAEQHAKLTAWIEENYVGSANIGKPMILDNAAKFIQTAMTGVDAQHLETRRFQIEEMCRGMGVLPIMVGYSDKATTYASAEQMQIAHNVHTARPLHRRIEHSMDRSLLTKEERAAGLYFKFLDAELLRGSAEARAKYYGYGIKDGWLTRNEARRFEDMNPLPGLDLPLRPLNMGDGSKPPTNEKPPAVPPGDPKPEDDK